MDIAAGARGDAGRSIGKREISEFQNFTTFRNAPKVGGGDEILKFLSFCNYSITTAVPLALTMSMLPPLPIVS